jgi:hypothetical protein
MLGLQAFTTKLSQKNPFLRTILSRIYEAAKEAGSKHGHLSSVLLSWA